MESLNNTKAGKRFLELQKEKAIDELATKIIEAGKPCPRCGSVNCVCDARPDDCE